ncbi:MAG: DUF255 domain-containing protein [Elusimicrobia bacterium]|nr:DUF255 domain-containing protein [Elusimicrobiota bacterium]
MRNVERTEEEKARSKRVHALVMIVLGAIMSLCALAAGLIAMSPGTFPSWMTGGWGRRETPAYRVPAKVLVPFVDFHPGALARAAAQRKLVLLHLAPSWSREARLMEETTYADAETAEWISKNVVATRADADERPDLAYLYGVGAWPTTALIHPDGRLLAAAARLTPKLLLPWAGLIGETLREHPDKADGLAADARRRLSAVRRRPEPPPGPDDAVWGGVHHSPTEHAKTLADQALVVLSTDAVRAKAALGFVERFMSLPGGGYASSVVGELSLPSGLIEEGSSYFAKDDAGRRAAGLPAADRRLFAGPSADMARAVLLSPVSSRAQKEHARRTLDLIWTRLARDGRVMRAEEGLADWPPDQWSVIEAELAAGRPGRARAVFARQDGPALRAQGPNPYLDALRRRLAAPPKSRP